MDSEVTKYELLGLLLCIQTLIERGDAGEALRILQEVIREIRK